MKNKIITAALVLSTFFIGFSQTSATKEALKESIHVKFKDGAKPTVFVDGKKFDFPFEFINPDIIASVSVAKGKVALEKYNAPNGVVLVTTKNEANLNVKLTDQGVSEIFSDKELKPLIIIDGKVSNKKVLKKLNSKRIEKINVIKGDAAKKKYNAPNGAIVVETKKS